LGDTFLVVVLLEPTSPPAIEIGEQPVNNQANGKQMLQPDRQRGYEAQGHKERQHEQFPEEY